MEKVLFPKLKIIYVSLLYLFYFFFEDATSAVCELRKELRCGKHINTVICLHVEAGVTFLF